EQAFYLAGYAAAQVTQSRRLGFVGSLITPEVVRHVNAFTLGARRFDPTVVVEVRWLGFWYDAIDDPPAGYRYQETVLAEELLATGCDVIAHAVTQNERVVEAVEAARKAGTTVWAIGNDSSNACTAGPTSCLGTTAWNWSPLYLRLIEQI